MSSLIEEHPYPRSRTWPDCEEEVERLRDELLTFRLGKHHAQNAELKAEIERLRALVSESR